MIFPQNAYIEALLGRNDRLAAKIDLVRLNSCYQTRQFLGSQSRPRDSKSDCRMPSLLKFSDGLLAKGEISAVEGYRLPPRGERFASQMQRPVFHALLIGLRTVGREGA